MRVSLLVLLLSALQAAGQESIRKDIATLAASGLGSKEGRAAWDRLAASGPEAASLLLEAMDTPSVPRVNWLVTAFDRVVTRAGVDKLDLDRLLAFAQDRKRQGRARRVAMDLVEQGRPGTRVKLLPG